MASIAHSTLHRALCNWRPPNRAAFAFRPPLETCAERSRSVLTGREGLIEKPRFNRTTAPIKRRLTVSTDLSKREIIFQLDRDECHIELTPRGPVLLYQNGMRDYTASSERLAIAIYTLNGSRFGRPSAETLKKMIACAAVKESAFSAFSISFMELFNSIRWPLERYSDTLAEHASVGAANFFLLATERKFSKLIDRAIKEGWKFVFLPPADMVRYGELIYAGDRLNRTNLNIHSYFRIGDTEIRIETECFGEPGTMITSMRSDLVSYNIPTLNETNKKQKAKKAHSELVGKIREGGIDFLNKLVVERTLRKAAA